MNDDLPPDYTVEELSRLDGCRPSYIRYLLGQAAPPIHGHKRGDRLWLIKNDEALQRWLRRTRRRSEKR